MEKIKPVILYVDDEIHNLCTFKAAFRRHYTILTANNAREAMHLLQENTVDLIITDQRMPEMTGVQFLEAIMPEFPEPARMILTGFSDIEAITKAINVGSVLRYITKPWNETELKQIIDMGVRIRELEKDSQLLLKNLEHELQVQKETLDRFAQYFPENINPDSLLEPENSSFEGEYRIITTVFADIRQFTRLSDSLEPKTLVNYLNHYFTIMVDCVIKNHGSIYKLVGDGLWAIFGWPVSSIFNQRNAVYCALDMLEELKKFNENFGQEINYETIIGIGISTGEAIVGKIHSEDFSSSVVVGDSVEYASKIEDLTRELPNAVLVSEAVYQSVKADIIAEMLTFTLDDGNLQTFYRVLGKQSATYLAPSTLRADKPSENTNLKL